MPTKQELLPDYAADIKYYQAHQCSCVKDNNGVYDPTDDCFYGWRYDDPVPDTIIGMDYKLFSGNFGTGYLYEGECNFLIFNDSTYFSKIGKGDVIVSSDQTIKKSCFLDYTENNMIPEFDVSEVLVVSSKSIEYTNGTDFNVVAQDGRTFIVWEEGNAHPEKFYSVEYTAEVNFLVWDVLPELESVNTNSTYKSVVCKLRKFGYAPAANIIDTMDFATKPGDFVNI